MRVREAFGDHPQDGVHRQSLPLPHETRPVDVCRRAVQRLRPVDRGAEGGPAFPDKLQDPAETITAKTRGGKCTNTKINLRAEDNETTSATMYCITAATVTTAAPNNTSRLKASFRGPEKPDKDESKEQPPVSRAKPEDGLVPHSLIAPEVAPPPAALDERRPYQRGRELVPQHCLQTPEHDAGGEDGAASAEVVQRA